MEGHHSTAFVCGMEMHLDGEEMAEDCFYNFIALLSLQCNGQFLTFDLGLVKCGLI